VVEIKFEVQRVQYNYTTFCRFSVAAMNQMVS